MRKIKKFLVSSLLAVTAGCCALTALILPKTGAEVKNANAATTVAYEAQFTVRGGSVRVSNTAGIRFHVSIPTDVFQNTYGGTIPDAVGKAGTIGDGWTTGTLLLPVNKLNGNELFAKADTANAKTYKATVSDSETTNMWYLREENDTQFMQTIVYLYDLPASNYGTEIAVRAYITNGTDYIYTEQENGISMSYVASEAYANANSEYAGNTELKATYIDKTVNLHVDGATSVQNVAYLANISNPAATERAADNDEFLGYYDWKGNEVDIKAPIKNNMDVYARYRESIVLSSLASDYVGAKFPIASYKRNSNDTVKNNQITFTAKDGSAYTLSYNAETEILSGDGLTTLTAETKDHGEGTVTATMINGNTGAEYTLTLPALVVTRELTRVSEISYTVQTVGWASDTSGIEGVSGVADGTVSGEHIFAYSNYVEKAEAAMFGYYRLRNDLGNFISGGKLQIGNPSQNTNPKLNDGGFNKPDQGFRGTLDGAGYTIMSRTGARGIFGQIGNGAVIKDVNFNVYGSYAQSNGTQSTHICLLAEGMFGATVENVSVKAVNGTINNNTTYQRAAGYLTAAGTSGTVFKNFTVNLGTASVSSLFGGHYWGNGYESVETINGKQNVYENVAIYAAEIASLGYNLHADSGNADVEALGVVVKIEDEQAAAGNDIVYTAGATAGAETATLAGDRQTVVMDDSTTWSLDLGKYSGLSVTNITLGSNSLGNDPAYLNIPDEVKTPSESNKHGEQNITVSLKKVDGYTLTLTVPVLLVTRDISTTAEFEECFDYTDGAARYYGYYRLANDIGWVNKGLGNPWTFNANARGGSNNEWWTNGFVGTFDGNNHTITGMAAGGGLFGRLAKGSTLKNVTIVDVFNNSGANKAVLGRTVTGATIENVTFKFQRGWSGAAVPSIPASNQYSVGWLANEACFGTTFTDCKIEADGYKFYSLFGSGWYHGYEARATNGTQEDYPNIYKNFIINVGDLEYIGYRYEDSTNSSALGTFYGFTPEDEIASGEDITINYTKMEYSVTLANTDIALNEFDGEARTTIDLGEFADWTFTSATDGFTYANGKLNVPASIADNRQKHGEYTVTIVMTSDLGQTATITAPITVVTQEIGTLTQLKTVLAYESFDMDGNGSITANQECGLFGYYTLIDDITYTTAWGDWNLNIATVPSGFNPEYESFGFRGTFDGRGKTITGRQFGNGIFGWIGRDAVVKNLNVVDVYWTNDTGAPILALTIAKATIENVNIEFKPYAANAAVPSVTAAYTGARQGWIASQWCVGATFRDVTVTANKDVNGNAASYGIGGLFGSCSYGGYEWKSSTVLQNTYDGLYINIDNLYSLGTVYDSNTKTYSGYTVEDEVGDNDGQDDIIYLNGVRVGGQLDENPTFETQDIVFASSVAADDVAVLDGNGNATMKINLGEYSQHVTALTLKTADGGTYPLTVNGDQTYTIPADLVSDLEAHGEGTLSVTVANDLPVQNFSFDVPVVLVTNRLMTTADFEATMNYTNDAKTLYGYYTLGANIGSDNLGSGQPWRFAATAAVDVYGGRGNSQYEYYAYGFRGTFDGRGNTIVGRAANGGLFGLIGNGAVIKNFTVQDVYFSGTSAGNSLLASFARGGIVENVTFKYEPTWATVAPSSPADNQYNTGWIVSTCCDGMTFIDCTVDAEDYDIYALFGAGWYAGYEHRQTNTTPAKTNNIYDNFNIKVNSLRWLGYWYEGSTAWNALGTFHGVTPEMEVNDDDGQNDIIHFNGESLVVLEEISEYAPVDIVLNGANKTVAMNGDGSATAEMTFGKYSEFVTELTLGDTNLSVDNTAGTFVLPKEIVSNLDKHGEYPATATVTNGSQVFSFDLTMTVVTLEITTADELSRFLRDYASVAKDEVYKGFTEAGQEFTDGITFLWEGTNEYSGYFTLGNDISYGSFTPTDKTLVVAAGGGIGVNPYDGSGLQPGGYYYGMGIPMTQGQENKGFRGTFDGRGFEIVGLRAMGYYPATVNRQYNAGVSSVSDFAYSSTGFISKLTKDGVIKNVGFTNAYCYTGSLISSWGGGTIDGVYVQMNSANQYPNCYVAGITSGSPVNENDLRDQLNLVKNTVVNVIDSNMPANNTLFGYTDINHKNLENVYVVGDSDFKGAVAYYYSSMYSNLTTGESFATTDGGTANTPANYLRWNTPLGLDSFGYYDDASIFLAERADMVNNAWGNYFSIQDDGIYYGGVKVLSGSASGDINGTNNSFLYETGIYNDKPYNSNYVIVYEKGNEKAEEAAAFIAEHVARATGTVTYLPLKQLNTETDFNRITWEHINGGVVLPTIAASSLDEINAKYRLIIGDVDVPANTYTGDYNIFANPVYDDEDNIIHGDVHITASNDRNYLAAAIDFLDEVVGYKGLNDGYVRYAGLNTDTALYDIFSTPVEANVAFETRSSTNANYHNRITYKGINGQTYFANSGPVTYQIDGNGAVVTDAKTSEKKTQVRSTHNSMWWLPNNMKGNGDVYAMYQTANVLTLPTGYQVDPNWYTNNTRDNGNYTGYDLCYKAHGDPTSYNNMVAYTAQHMLNVLNYFDPNNTVAYPLTFGCMDDLMTYYQCSCGAHSKTGSSVTTEIIDFLNAVCAKITSLQPDRLFEIHMLAYYYAESPESLTDAYVDDRIGVIYAPIARTTIAQGGTDAKETLSIYDDANATVRERIEKWTQITDKVSFWFYSTMFSDFLMPFDTFESMITWIEFAAKACEGTTTDGRQVRAPWFTVNGQSANHNPTVFEDFKAYIIQMAEIEILDKIQEYGMEGDDLAPEYLNELECEFFGLVGGGSKVSDFTDDGYYGPAAANKAMYDYYQLLRTDYQGLRDGNAQAYTGETGWIFTKPTFDDMSGCTVEAYDYVKSGTSAGSQGTTSTFADYLSGSNTYMYFPNWTKAKIQAYMGYLDTAMAAVEAYGGPNKEIAKRHILQESLFPRFVIAMSNSSNSTYGWSGGYTSSVYNWGTKTVISTSTNASLANIRTQLYHDFYNLGWVKYSEHNNLKMIVDKWVSNGWTRPANYVLNGVAL